MDAAHHIYAADGATETGTPRDGFEAARIEWVPLADVPRLVVKREIVSSSTITALLLSLHGRAPERQHPKAPAQRSPEENQVSEGLSSPARSWPMPDLHGRCRRRQADHPVGRRSPAPAARPRGRGRAAGHSARPHLRAVPEAAGVVEVTAGGPARRPPAVPENGQLLDLYAHIPIVRAGLL
jgi:hypothetical protein